MIEAEEAEHAKVGIYPNGRESNHSVPSFSNLAPFVSWAKAPTFEKVVRVSAEAMEVRLASKLLLFSRQALYFA